MVQKETKNAKVTFSHFEKINSDCIQNGPVNDFFLFCAILWWKYL